MYLIDLAAEIFSSNSPLVISFGVVAIIYLIYLKSQKSRSKLAQSKIDRLQQERDAVIDAIEKIQKLKKMDLNQEEVEKYEKQILDTIPTKEPYVEAKEVVKFTEISKDKKEQNRLSMFIRGLFYFGFLSIWCLGWGVGWGVFVIPFASDFWLWTVSPQIEISLITKVWRWLVLILSVIVAVGFWILPTLAALLGAFANFLKMILAIFPNSFCQSIIEKLTELNEKYLQ